MATNMEKHILQCYRWVVYVTQNQRICDYIEILFFNGLFQNKYF